MSSDCSSITPDCPVEATVYGYYPSIPANVFFAAFFGLCLLVQIAQGIRWKTWTFSIALTIGCLTECLGYIGRIIMHGNPFSNVGFEMQICCLIMAPAFLAVGIYLTLKHFVLAIEPEFSRIPARLYPWFFFGCDIFSLTLQAIGGGIAASSNDDQQAKIGGNIMLAGIVIQVVTLLIFSALAIDFFVRVYQNRNKLSPGALEIMQNLRFKFFVAAIGTATVAIFIRCVYRIPELSGGWANPVMRDETDFIVLDGVMCTIATLFLTVFHPGYCFKPMQNLRPTMRRNKALAEKQARSTSESDVEAGNAAYVTTNKR